MTAAPLPPSAPPETTPGHPYPSPSPWGRRLAELSMLTTESLGLFVLAAVLAAAAGGGGPAFVTVWAGMLGGFYLVRFLQNFDTGRPALIGAGIAGTLLGLLVLLNLQYDRGAVPLTLGWLGRFATDPEGFLAGKAASVYGVIIVTVAWFRGVAVAQRELTYAAALTSYTAGLLALVVLLLFGQGTRAAPAIDGAALPYFMLGLLTLSFIHLGRAQQQEGGLLRGPWVATLLATVGTLMVVSMLIGLFPLNAVNELLAPLGALLLRALDLLIFIVVLPIAILVEWIVRALLRDPIELRMQDPNRVATDAAEQLQRSSEQGGLAALIMLLVKVLFLLALAVAIGYLLWWVFRRLRRPLRDSDESREFIAHEGSLGDDLGALLSGLLGRFHRPSGPEREPVLPDDVLAVRRAYLRALRKAEGVGVVRPPAATPAEFAPVLSDTLHTPAAETLSERFAAARYGLVTTPREELRALEREL